MVEEIRYTNINRVLDNLKDHPMLSNITLEQVVRHTVRFIGLHGYSRLYSDRFAEIDIHEFRGVLPCDCISVVQVKDAATGVCLRSMTDNFYAHGISRDHDECGGDCIDPMNNMRDRTPHRTRDMYIPEGRGYMEEPAFKTQGNVIFTTFPNGRVNVAYKAIPVDDDGFPLLIDNENYLAALEAYIKKQVFTVKFDQQEISASVLKNAQQEYAVLSRELQSEFTVPSQSEMESIARMWNTLIPRVRQFDDGFRHLGDREYLRRS